MLPEPRDLRAGKPELNLRNLGAQRTLVLFDGRRLPAANPEVVPDVDLIPDALIQRVDVVTGGASAVYGSDAVAGVVNFILDTNFTGIKGSVSGGESGYGDASSDKIELSAGTTFFDGRLHMLVSGDQCYQAQIPGTARPWNVTGQYDDTKPGLRNQQKSAGVPLSSPAASRRRATSRAASSSAGRCRARISAPRGSVGQYNYGTVSRPPGQLPDYGGGILADPPQQHGGHRHPDASDTQTRTISPAWVLTSPRTSRPTRNSWLAMTTPIPGVALTTIRPVLARSTPAIPTCLHPLRHRPRPPG